MMPLAERLFLKPGMAAAVINAPDGVATELGVTRGLKVPGTGKVALDWLLVFVPDQAAVKKFAPTVPRAIRPDAVRCVDHRGRHAWLEEQALSERFHGRASASPPPCCRH